MATKDKIKDLTRLLYPTGRAFNMPRGGNFDKLHSALAESESDAYESASSILFSILPDNPNFTVDDAEDWERRLGMITNPAVPLPDRMAAIIRKMNHPGDIPARQSWDFLEQSLQLAGFDVYVHENIPETDPATAIAAGIPELGEMGGAGSEMGEIEMGSAFSVYPGLFYISEMGADDSEMGAIEMGGIEYKNKVVNEINEYIDSLFPIVGNYRSTFYIGGQNFGTFADVDVNRKDEFRQTILRIKPAHSVGLLLINYI